MKKMKATIEKDYIIYDSKKRKVLQSQKANYYFDKETGQMLTWGKDVRQEVEKFPAPTILDLEITTKCDGVLGVLCPFCYKANNPKGKNMSFETFKQIFDKLPKTITQIAFGTDSKCKMNPDIWKMMKYTRKNGVIPNVTGAQIDRKTAKKISKYCGAVAVSRYGNSNIFAESIQNLTKLKMEQVTVHMMISEETYVRALNLLAQIRQDPRLEKVSSVVFLSLKTKGRGVNFHPLSQEKFNNLIHICKESKINVGFDSCSSLKYFNSLSEKEYEKLNKYVQPCESTLESAYINVDGDFFPCSFTEGTEGWEKGLNVIKSKDFVKDIWENSRTKDFRNKLLNSKDNNKFKCRNCPIFNI